MQPISADITVSRAVSRRIKATELLFSRAFSLITSVSADFVFFVANLLYRRLIPR